MSEQSASMEQILTDQRNHVLASIQRHPFLVRFASGDIDVSALRRFGIQWYLTTRLHKAAFPALILNTADDDIRFDLIENLRDEYGSGVRADIHTRLLERFLLSIGLERHDFENAPLIEATRNFTSQVDDAWRHGDPVVAFGIHFAFEVAAARLHDAFATGVMSAPIPSDPTYFQYHQTAEPHHAADSARGFALYATSASGRGKLIQGVRYATVMLTDFLDRIDLHVFERAAA